MKEKIGFVGLGEMGKWMASNIMKAGFPLTVYDKRKEAMQALIDQGAEAADDPSNLAGRVQWVFLSVPDTEVVEEVIFGPKGLSEGARPGLVIVDTSTIGYLPTLEVDRRLREQGIIFADAPVSGMEARAKEATLTVMFSLEWRLTLLSIAIVPIFVAPTRSAALDAWVVDVQ